MEPVKTQTASVPIKFYGERNLYGEFSNFYKAEIVIDGKTWPTTEHYFQAQKFAGIDEDYLEKVRTCKTPGEAKKVARAVEITRRSDWSDVKYYVMLEALEAKFTQHLDLKKKLLDTGNKELIENAPHDYQWGCGADGTGKNWLGKALMEVRELLQQQEAEKSKKAQ